MLPFDKFLRWFGYEPAIEELMDGSDLKFRSLSFISFGSSALKGVDRILPSPIFLFGDSCSSNSTIFTMESPPCKEPPPIEDVGSPENYFDRYSWFLSMVWLWKTWGRDVLLPFVAKLLAERSAFIRGENIVWLWAKYILIDSLWRLEISSPLCDIWFVPPPGFVSLFIETIVFSSFCFSFCSAFFDSRSVAMTAYYVSS